MRVLHVINSGGHECSGIARIVLGFAQRADAQRYRIECLFLRPGPLVERFRHHGVPTHVLSQRSQTPGALISLPFLRFLRKGNYDIVHLHNGGRSVQYPVKWSSARQVLHIHGLNESPEKGTRPFPVVGVDEVIVVSDLVAQAMGGRKVTIVHPGIEFSPANAKAHARTVAPVIGTLGRLVRVKGITHVLAAFSQLSRQLPEAQLEIAGDGPELKKLVSESERLGISSRVSFLGWVQHPQELLARWSVYAHPSLQEAVGLAVIEASAAGLPVVASRVGGIPEIVQDGVSGYLVDAGDDTALAQSLLKVLASPQQAQKMGQAGSVLVSNRFSLEQMCSGIQAVYERVISQPTRVVQGSLVPHPVSEEMSDRSFGSRHSA